MSECKGHCWHRTDLNLTKKSEHGTYQPHNELFSRVPGEICCHCGETKESYPFPNGFNGYSPDFKHYLRTSDEIQE